MVPERDGDDLHGVEEERSRNARDMSDTEINVTAHRL